MVSLCSYALRHPDAFEAFNKSELHEELRENRPKYVTELADKWKGYWQDLEIREHIKTIRDKVIAHTDADILKHEVPPYREIRHFLSHLDRFIDEFLVLVNEANVVSYVHQPCVENGLRFMAAYSVCQQGIMAESEASRQMLDLTENLITIHRSKYPSM